MNNLSKSAFFVVSSLAFNANAAVPAEVTSALADAKTDGMTVAGTVLTVIIAIAAFKYIRKAL